MSEEDAILEELLHESSDDAGDDSVLRADEKKSRKKQIAVLSAGALALVLVAGAGVALSGANPLGGKQATSEQRTQDIGADESSSGDFDGIDEFWASEDKYFPVEKAGWQKSPIEESNALEKKRGEILETVLNDSSDLYNASMTLPSEAAGFTADSSQEFLSDDSPNPQYSFWTAEVFQAEAQSAIERLLNPVYGGWEKYQYPEFEAGSKFDTSIFSDIFAPSFFEANADKQPSEYMPVYADWKSNDYGEKRLLGNGGPRWFGQVKQSTTKFSYDEKTSSYTAEFTGDVVFTAWTESEEKIEKKGQLKLRFVPNVKGEDDGASNKVVIDQAQLTIGD